METNSPTPNTPIENQEHDVTIRKRIAIFGSIVAVLLLGAYGFVWYLGNKNFQEVTRIAEEANRKQHEQAAERAATQNSKGKITVIDPAWNLYTNNRLGFSIEIPNDPTIITREEGNLFFIGYPGELSKVLESFKNGIDDHERTEGITWAFQVAEVRSDEDLISFIKNEYGIECTLREKRERSEQRGTYDVLITNEEGYELGPEGCFVNWVTQMYYSPKLGKLVQWDLGQSVAFIVNGGMGEAADGRMRSSFRFIQGDAQ
jgi:hypothetical protein